MKINERIKLIRKHLGLNQKEFGDILGVSQRAVSNWESGRNEPSIEVLNSISTKWAINPTWLLTGRGEMFLNQEEKPKSLPQTNGEIVEVPFFPETYAAAGAGAEAYEVAPKKLKFSKDFLRELLDVAIFQGIHIITAVGDSMNPTIESGDKLFILPFYAENNQIKEGGIYIIATPQGTLVKRIYPNPFTNTYTLKSDNHHVADIVIQGDELDSTKIIGRVVGILRHA